MKTNSYKCLLILCVLIIGLSRCTKEYYTTEEIHQTDEYYVGSEATNYPFTIGNNERPWSWNESNGRYEYYEDFDALNINMYNYGSIVGGIFVNPGEPDEWLEMLPYQAVYHRDNDGPSIIDVPFFVNISCAFAPGQVGFFLQPSDRKRDDSILDIYEFRVTLMWDEYNLENETE